MPRSPRRARFIDPYGRFLLQQRDKIVGILYPGKGGLFGGHREGSETFLECAVREVQEELSDFIPAKRFDITGEDIESDSGGSVRGAFFVAREIPVETLVITEGALLIVDPDNVTALDQRLTPTARFALKAFGTVAARKEQ